MKSLYEDRGTKIEKMIAQLSSFSVKQKRLIIEYLEKTIKIDSKDKPKKPRAAGAKISSLEELVQLYKNVDFTGFFSRKNDKEQYQLWKLIDAFEEVTKKIGRKNFDKLRITLIVFGDKISYVSDGSISLNYERFSKDDLVKQLVRIFRSQG
ncbi:MAG: hypothetical protein UW92_C0002G0031 [Candidatus Jorgensenbacteria bacterium GW2011_GWA2_45_13]|uniref:Uncharacterized protein n=1 Tax=Candidatus Jorgensenbacteria bacterium GW2011_GWA2_45_13 TaxID=1618662 RepID=A0A0G1NGZ5_9BACT|nr:MAG: hypothetical protein UW92_C0002G0031 [Candidatus Jorgensenbacteria bacterium GW2011_GWA2_45_13]